MESSCRITNILRQLQPKGQAWHVDAWGTCRWRWRRSQSAWPVFALVAVHQMLNDLQTKLFFAPSSPHIERPYRPQESCLYVHTIDQGTPYRTHRIQLWVENTQAKQKPPTFHTASLVRTKEGITICYENDQTCFLFDVIGRVCMYMYCTLHALSFTLVLPNL